MARLEIQALEIDPAAHLPVVLLKVLGQGKFLPHWVGLSEANAIALKMQGVDTPRPMTHDLMKNAIRAVGATVDRVALTDLRENTYFATIYLSRDREEITLDSRPSDAFSLALRWPAPILIDDEVLERSGTFPSIESWLEACRQNVPPPESD